MFRTFLDVKIVNGHCVVRVDAVVREARGNEDALGDGRESGQKVIGRVHLPGVDPAAVECEGVPLVFGDQLAAEIVRERRLEDRVGVEKLVIHIDEAVGGREAGNVRAGEAR